MNNEMPTMPAIPDAGESVKTSLPGELDPTQEVVETSEEYDDKPEYVNPEKNDSIVDIPTFPKTGIKVVAIRKGFYNQKRINEGEEFIVKRKESLGTWMKCLDPAMERERVKFFKDKKAEK